MGVVAAGAGDDSLAGDGFLDGLDQLDLLVVAEGRRLTGGARDDDAVRTVRD